MTTLQDRAEAYAKYNAAVASNAANTTFGAIEEMGGGDIPDTAAYEAPKHSPAKEITSSLVLAYAKRAMESEEELWAFSTLAHEISRHEFSLSRSPFDRLDDLRSDQEKVRDLISHIERALSVPFARKLAKRLKFLSEVAEEEAPGQAELSPESLRMFIKFLELAPELKYPGVMLSPAGNTRVQWRAAPSKHFVAEFYPDGEVRFVIFRPDPGRPDRTSRLSGIAFVESLLSTAEPHGVLDWAGR